VVGAVAVAGRGFRSLVATAGADKNIRIWDESTGILLHLMQGHLDAIFSLSFWFGHEILLVSGGADHSVRVWDILTGENVCTLLGHKDMVTGVVVATNPEPAIISSSIDCTVKVWDLDYILTLFYRSSIMCFPHSKGKRNDLPADNPKYHFQKKSRAELMAASPNGEPEPKKAPPASAIRDTDVSIAKEGQGGGQSSFEDMFDSDVRPVEETSGPVLHMPRRQSSFTMRMFGSGKGITRSNSITPSDKKKAMMGDYITAGAKKDMEMEKEKGKAKAALSKKLAVRRGAVEDEHTAPDAHEHHAEAANVKEMHAAETARYRYSMDLKRGDAADALRKRLDAIAAKASSKKESSSVSPDPDVGDGDSDSDGDDGEVEAGLRDPTAVEKNNDDYEALMSSYRDKFN
jgi:hypothetical protein